ncbi:unnamed protein product [Musa acuminata subsp. malaccensis]|uniref:(wild Malaysian banana) hypothetical protein n=1 Tax=Musa acuminata subsp. malaccensis TaxID=214687 RepID=A0A804J6M1_MUSAM|nr:unnamed protein product [Musa acuminata subsp. malaccensis]
MFCRANWPHDIDVSVAEKVFLRQCKRKKATKTAIADDESPVAQLDSGSADDLKSIKETPEEKQTSFHGSMSGVFAWSNGLSRSITLAGRDAGWCLLIGTVALPGVVVLLHRRLLSGVPDNGPSRSKPSQEAQLAEDERKNRWA